MRSSNSSLWKFPNRLLKNGLCFAMVLHRCHAFCRFTTNILAPITQAASFSSYRQHQRNVWAHLRALIGALGYDGLNSFYCGYQIGRHKRFCNISSRSCMGRRSRQVETFVQRQDQNL
jgi:hypothetical protein